MKILIVMFMLVAALTRVKADVTPEERQLLQGIHMKCMKESGVDEEAFGRAILGDGVVDPKLKDHAFCFSRNMGFMNDAGDILIDDTKKMMYEHLDKDKAELVISKCLVTKGTPQETAFDMSKCMLAVKFAS